ncbi:MAG: hypothetical protein ACE5JI_20805, partial [Acidobacteriota bacterium]
NKFEAHGGDATIQWAVLGRFWRTGLAMEHCIAYATIAELATRGEMPGLLILQRTESSFVRLLISDRG